ncbi:gibberellin 2-beta-dioxygenase 2-like [Argentina anserina]|uniref:gibberellin 2-beta-dioxygenase 2-like n=1 Tax=Argentina anserina TaxID=57926 RepID=UPI00217659DD|nr:gibberellin 2-beta-dioxygenase 2-like [Potentilla anserina]XP_050373798.1 gibberellin 2-beta-dioxygenase 2-like [Potentilla anserina]
MVVASPNLIRNEKIQVVDLPVIDLSAPRSVVSKLIVKACEDYGFFKVINHGVPQKVISRMEEKGFAFFSKTVSEKQRAGPVNPFGYGCKNIGNNGDMGEIEYLLFNTDNASIAQRSKTISEEPTKFSSAVSDYIEAVSDLACELLEVIAEGLWVPDTSVFSRLIRDVESDSVFRINYYPPTSSSPTSKVGFGEHTDPQILTLLRSNDVGGLQISPQDGVWVPVPSDPAAFCVNVGDALQAMTNGRFVSVKHRALTNSFKSRMSMALFSGPPLNASLTALPEMVTPENPLIYKQFTWAEYKKTTYSLRLGDSRLNLFRIS